MDEYKHVESLQGDTVWVAKKRGIPFVITKIALATLTAHEAQRAAVLCTLTARNVFAVEEIRFDDDEVPSLVQSDVLQQLKSKRYMYVIEPDNLDAVQSLLDATRQFEGGALPSTLIRTIISSVASLLALIHAENQSYGVVTAANIVLKADGSLSLRPFPLHHQRGKPWATMYERSYTAPELLYPPHAITAEGDMWSLGCLLYAMSGATAFPPFYTRSDDRSQQLRRIVEVLGSPTSLSEVPATVRMPLRDILDNRRGGSLLRKEMERLTDVAGPEVAYILRRLLEYAPDMRISAEKVLSDKFCTANDENTEVRLSAYRTRSSKKKPKRATEEVATSLSPAKVETIEIDAATASDSDGDGQGRSNASKVQTFHIQATEKTAGDDVAKPKKNTVSWDELMEQRRNVRSELEVGDADTDRRGDADEDGDDEGVEISLSLAPGGDDEFSRLTAHVHDLSGQLETLQQLYDSGRKSRTATAKHSHKTLVRLESLAKKLRHVQHELRVAKSAQTSVQTAKKRESTSANSSGLCSRSGKPKPTKPKKKSRAAHSASASRKPKKTSSSTVRTLPVHERLYRQRPQRGDVDIHSCSNPPSKHRTRSNPTWDEANPLNPLNPPSRLHTANPTSKSADSPAMIFYPSAQLLHKPTTTATNSADNDRSVRTDRQRQRRECRPPKSRLLGEMTSSSSVEEGHPSGAEFSGPGGRGREREREREKEGVYEMSAESYDEDVADVIPNAASLSLSLTPHRASSSPNRHTSTITAKRTATCNCTANNNHRSNCSSHSNTLSESEDSPTQYLEISVCAVSDVRSTAPSPRYVDSDGSTRPAMSRFLFRLDASGRTATTQPGSLSPSQTLPVDLQSLESLSVEVIQVNHGGEEINHPRRNGIGEGEILGRAEIDLAMLKFGVREVNGWYHIRHPISGAEIGQIHVRVVPRNPIHRGEREIGEREREREGERGRERERDDEWVQRAHERADSLRRLYGYGAGDYTHQTSLSPPKSPETSNVYSESEEVSNEYTFFLHSPQRQRDPWDEIKRIATDLDDLLPSTSTSRFPTAPTTPHRGIGRGLVGDKSPGLSVTRHSTRVGVGPAEELSVTSGVLSEASTRMADPDSPVVLRADIGP